MEVRSGGKRRRLRARTRTSGGGSTPASGWVGMGVVRTQRYVKGELGIVCTVMWLASIGYIYGCITADQPWPYIYHVLRPVFTGINWCGGKCGTRM